MSHPIHSNALAICLFDEIRVQLPPLSLKEIVAVMLADEVSEKAFDFNEHFIYYLQ